MRARLTLLIPTVGFGAVTAACLLVPVVFTRQTSEAFMVAKFTVLLVLLPVMVAGVVAWGAATRRWPLPATKLTWPLAALVGWTALATAASSSPTSSLIGQYGRYDGFATLLAGVAMALCIVAYCWRDPSRLAHLAVALVASAVVGAAYVALQKAGWDWIDWYTEANVAISQPYGLLGNSNFSGAHLAIAVPLVIALTGTELGARWRWALWSLAAALVLALAATETSGGFLALFGGVAVTGWLAPALVPKVLRWTAVVLVAVALLFVAATTATNIAPGEQHLGEGRLVRNESLMDRLEIWGAARQMIVEHPLVGVGPDAFGLEYPYVHEVRPGDTPDLRADEAHNTFIDRAATAGLPALAAYLWLIATIAVAVRRTRAVVPSDQRWLLAGFAGAGSGYLLQGSVSIDVVPLAMVGWVCVGALAVLADPLLQARRASPDDPIVVHPLPLPAFAALGLAVVLAALQGIRPFGADLHHRNGIEAIRDGRPASVAAAEFETATAWLPWEPAYRRRQADQLVAIASQATEDRELRDRLLAEAVVGYRQALDLVPADDRTVRALARALVIQAEASDDPRTFEASYREATDLLTDLAREIPSDQALALDAGRALEGFAAGTRSSDADRLRDRATVELEESLRGTSSDWEALSTLARIAAARARWDDALDYALRADAATGGADEGVAQLLAEIREERVSPPG